MSVDWGMVKSFLIFFAPILLPKIIAYYRALRATPDSQVIRPIPLAISRALLLLLLATIYFLVQSFTYFSPEEIFSLTKSRINTPNDVLFTRLSSIREFGLTGYDEALRSKLSSVEARLLYFQHGPSTIVDCTFCRTDDPKSYFFYSLPILLFPHLLNLSILGVSTSSFFTGRQGNAWRTQACIVALGGSALDLYLVAKYSYRNNSHAARLEDIDLFFWKSRTHRFHALALLDGLFAWLLYLSSTGRAFPQPPSLKERIKDASRTLDSVRSKVFATGVLKNTVVRDENLQTINQQYWTNEVQLTRAIMEEREVNERINDALERRININRIGTDAQDYAKDVITSIHKYSEMND